MFNTSSEPFGYGERALFEERQQHVMRKYVVACLLLLLVVLDELLSFIEPQRKSPKVLNLVTDLATSQIHRIRSINQETLR